MGGLVVARIAAGAARRPAVHVLRSRVGSRSLHAHHRAAESQPLTVYIARVDMRDHLALLPPLVDEFPRWLNYFVDHGPFTKPQQLRCHLKTIDLRSKHASAIAAAQDLEFVKALHDTLRAWGLGTRGSKFCPLEEFGPALRRASATLEPLEPRRIDADDLDIEGSIESIWKAVESIDVTRNNAPLVAGSKALHHLLPDLVPPMDRAYTQRFFGWHNPQFQYHQAQRFSEAYSALVDVDRRVKASKYVRTHPWHSSVSKVLDNGLVGLVSAIRDGVEIGGIRRTNSPFVNEDEPLTWDTYVTIDTHHEKQ